ncbi:MAG: hypothetical protein R3Y04_09030 [Rikenellaceae bacterium]
MKNFLIVILLSLVAIIGCKTEKDNLNKQIIIEVPQITGEWRHIFNPNDTRKEIDTTWYTNDHCFAKGGDGSWHAYGIIGHKPINPWVGETKLFHISASDINQQTWDDHDYALEIVKGVERVLWAPHVFYDEGSDSWQMFYNIGNMQPNANMYCSWGGLCRADSKNMFDWQRHELNPQFTDFGHARDSYIIKINNIYHYYYTRTVSEIDLRSAVALRTSPDLECWSGAKIVHIQEDRSDHGGDCESPYIVKRGDVYYLFICRAMTAYDQTHVYWSTDPTTFPNDNFVCELPTHASEIIKVSDNEWYISNTGWNKQGIYIAPLKWVAAELVMIASLTNEFLSMPRYFSNPLFK